MIKFARSRPGAAPGINARANSAVFIRHIMVFARRRRERLYARFVSIRIMRHQSKQVFIVRVTTGYGSREHKHIHAVCTIPCVTCSNIFYRRAYISRARSMRATHTPSWRLTCMLMLRAHTLEALSLTRSNDARLSTLVCPIHHKGLCVVISIICGSYTRAQIQCDLRVDFDLIGRASGVLTKPRAEFVG
jgi:hypothetical protein